MSSLETQVHGLTCQLLALLGTSSGQSLMVVVLDVGMATPLPSTWGPPFHQAASLGLRPRAVSSAASVVWGGHGASLAGRGRSAASLWGLARSLGPAAESAVPGDSGRAW